MMSRFRISIFVLALLAVAACGKDDKESSNPREKVVNVDVILPPDIVVQWRHSIDWAMDNIAQAQRNCERKVRLNLRYHDEETEDLDALGYKLSHPEEGADSCHAIIGPYSSDNAAIILKYARVLRIPVVMPTCSSAELHRTNARSTYSWFMTESDITQCEIMLSSAGAMQADKVALICSDDTYGKSFQDWLGYYATELELNLAEPGILVYRKGMMEGDVDQFITRVEDNCEAEDHVVFLLALSNSLDYMSVSSTILGHRAQKDGLVTSTLCADTALSQELLDLQKYIPITFGISPYASANYGFPQAFKANFGHYPFNGDAQVYDGLCLIALGAAHQWAHPNDCIVDGVQVTYTEKPKEPGLTDHMRAVVCSQEGVPTHWDGPGLALAFSETHAGRSIDMNGATGNLFFDKDTRTKILNTTYMAWTLDGLYKDDYRFISVVQPVIYLSTSGSATDASVNNFWLMDKQHNQSFGDVSYQAELPPIGDYWAVVISPSTTWSNYRHQADAFAMYQSLKHHGYDDDHIILIVEDNLADNPLNVFKGQIFVERDSNDSGDDILINEDVRKGAIVDYHFTDLTRDDIMDIMTGQKSDRLPYVISPKIDSDVFFFWSGHGGSKEGPLWGNEDSYLYFGMDRIRSIVDKMDQKGMYRRILFAIETCYSGKWGEALEGCTDVLVLTAANPYESSKADVHDRDLGVYLSNAFARTFRNEVNKNNNVTIYDLFKELAQTTNGSHVTIYNNEQYGSVYTETVKDFFPE